jgi:hypothetical protein
MDGFRFSLQWNDSYAFRDYPSLTEYQRFHQQILPAMSGHSRPGVRRCEKCGDLLSKWEESLSGLMLKVRQYDISVTYDGIVVVSHALKSAYDQACLAGLVFRPLPSDSAFFDIMPSRVVYFDAERRKTRFSKPCSTCGHYESVNGGTPVFLKSGSALGRGEFVRTDLEFGNLDGKHPLILCDVEAGMALREFKLKGLDLQEFVTERERVAMEKQEGKRGRES